MALKETVVAGKEDGHQVVRALQTTLETQHSDLGVLELEKAPCESDIADLLQFFRTFGEDPARRACLTQAIKTQFATAVFPKLAVVIGKTAEGESLSPSLKSSALLHKALRISLNLVNVFLAVEEKKENLEDFG